MSDRVNSVNTFSPKLRRLLCAVCACALLLPASQCSESNVRASEVSARSGLAASDHVRDATELKAMMVLVIAFQKTHPGLASRAEVSRLSENAGDLIVLFEGMNDPESLNILISLRSYYFGSGAGEVFDCLLLEKGSEVLPFLGLGQVNECEQGFGPEVRRRTTAVEAQAACLSNSELRDSLNQITHEIRQKQTCSLRDFY
jgi:hypothetical protein